MERPRQRTGKHSAENIAQKTGDWAANTGTVSERLYIICECPHAPLSSLSRGRVPVVYVSEQ